jgi:hypothetical protein
MASTRALNRGVLLGAYFQSTGALTIVLNMSKTKVSGSFDFDGPVFGGGDPAPIPFDIPLNKNGGGSVKIVGTSLGDITGTFTKDGTLTQTITNIPGGFLTSTKLSGKFDLKNRTYKSTYQIFTNSGLFAEGVANARVPGAPRITVVKTVSTAKPTVSINAKALTSSPIVSAKAKATRGAKVKVSGKNPYRLAVSKLPKGKTVLTFTLSNKDGFKATKKINITRK